jgi:hypothetical protein
MHRMHRRGGCRLSAPKHPIRRVLAREELLAELERWTDRILEETGSGTIEVSIELNVKDRRFLGFRLGGAASRRALTPVPEEA